MSLNFLARLQELLEVGNGDEVIVYLVILGGHENADGGEQMRPHFRFLQIICIKAYVENTVLRDQIISVSDGKMTRLSTLQERFVDLLD